MADSMTHQSNRTPFLSTYMPFICAISIVCILSSVSSFLLGHGTISNYTRAMNLFMGFFYLTFAVPKLTNIKEFAKSFSTYDIIAKRSKGYAQIYPFIELVLGTELLLNNQTSNMLISRIFIVLIIVISTFGFIGVGKALLENKCLDCACMGSKFSFPLSKISLMENGLMLIMAAAMLILPMATM